MSDARSLLDEMQVSQAQHLPLVAAFLERMGLAAVVNAAVPTEMAVDLGSVVKLMVLDTLSGRSPLYRLESFAAALDTGLLLGREVRAGAFNDTTLGRALDAIYACGSEQLLSQIALAAAAAFPAEVDMRHLHFLATSVSVWGEYAARAADAPEELRVTYGYSKDQRPDPEAVPRADALLPAQHPAPWGLRGRQCLRQDDQQRRAHPALRVHGTARPCRGGLRLHRRFGAGDREEPRGHRRQPLHHPPAIHLRRDREGGL